MFSNYNVENYSSVLLLDDRHRKISIYCRTLLNENVLHANVFGRAHYKASK